MFAYRNPLKKICKDDIISLTENVYYDLAHGHGELKLATSSYRNPTLVIDR